MPYWNRTSTHMLCTCFSKCVSSPFQIIKRRGENQQQLLLEIKVKIIHIQYVKERRGQK